MIPLHIDDIVGVHDPDCLLYKSSRCDCKTIGDDSLIDIWAAWPVDARGELT